MKMYFAKLKTSQYLVWDVDMKGEMWCILFGGYSNQM